MKMREEKALEVNKLKETLEERKKKIAYYDRFMEVTRHDIQEEIEELNKKISYEHEQKELSIA